MTKQEHLMTIVMEECSEIAEICLDIIKRVSKAQRFGLDEIQPGQPHTNGERIMMEVDDLEGVLNMLQHEGLLREHDWEAARKKQEKVTKYLDYSKEQGTLTE